MLQRIYYKVEIYVLSLWMASEALEKVGFLGSGKDALRGRRKGYCAIKFTFVKVCDGGLDLPMGGSLLAGFQYDGVAHKRARDF
jgi:hypothetical protein